MASTVRQRLVDRLADMDGSREDRRPLIHKRDRDKRCYTKFILVLVLSVTLAATVLPMSFAYWHTVPSWLKNFVSDSPEIHFKLNSVSADNPTCSSIGAKVLNKLHGNAIDAAISAILCSGVTNFYSAGIGGGSFLLMYNSSTNLSVSLDYRECASKHAKASMYNSSTLAINASLFGGLSIAVPGELSGLMQAHRLYGRLPWRQLVTPVIKLLTDGHQVSKPLARAMSLVWPLIKNVDSNSPYSQLRDWMLNPVTGRIYRSGELLIDRKLAKTFQLIADNPQQFYSGKLAKLIIKELASVGAIIDKKDLINYKPVARKTISVAMENSQVVAHVMQPPSSGAALAFGLRVLDGFQMTERSIKSSLESYSTFLHRTIEAQKFSYSLRSWLGDPEFVDVGEVLKNLTSEKFADEIRRKIDDNFTHGVEYYGPSFSLPSDSGTSHLSIFDADGNAVAVTSTINTYFGSLIRGRLTGIIYNNEMADFSLPNSRDPFSRPVSPFNLIQPNKRPMSTMSPIILTNKVTKKVKFISGAAGGSRIMSGLMNSIARHLWLNETVKQSTDSYRLHHQLVPNEIVINKMHSDALPESVVDELKRRGHKWSTTDEITVVEAIEIHADSNNNSKNIIYACSDYRKESHPDGV